MSEKTAYLANGLKPGSVIAYGNRRMPGRVEVMTSLDPTPLELAKGRNETLKNQVAALRAALDHQSRVNAIMRQQIEDNRVAHCSVMAKWYRRRRIRRRFRDKLGRAALVVATFAAGYWWAMLVR